MITNYALHSHIFLSKFLTILTIFQQSLDVTNYSIPMGLISLEGYYRQIGRRKDSLNQLRQLFLVDWDQLFSFWVLQTSVHSHNTLYHSDDVGYRQI